MQTKRQSGFSLAELLIATALGLVVAGLATMLYKQAETAAWTSTQRATMQQDARAASDLMMMDISMAGTGLQGAVGLVSGTGILAPRYGCDSSTCYLNSGSGLAYPVSGGVYSIYPVMPNHQGGISVKGKPTDTITIAYEDTTFLLNCYTATVTSSTTVTFTTPATPASGCSSGTVPAAVGSATGLQAGDIVYFVGSTSGGTGIDLVGEVTGTGGLASPYTATFATTSTLDLNQTSASTGSFASCFASKGTGCTGTAWRLYVISYYIALASDGTPTLMRQVNGQTPDPVAPNVLDLEFTYDTYDATANTFQAGITPTTAQLLNIKKVNLVHMVVWSSKKGMGLYQGIDIQTSTSIRNLGIPSS